MPRRPPLAVLSVAALLAPAAAPAQAPFRDFDRYVNEAMARWEVPGLALAIVRNDSVVYAKGYGVRTLGTSDRVDARTLFAIGSSSKAFTAASVGMLVDEQRLAWDDAAARHLPGLRLFDPYASQEVTVRDLMSHRSGLSRGDRLWYGSTLSRDEILRRVRFLEPTWSFRARFGYQNIMFLAAGAIVERYAGTSWDDFVRTRIFAPLGMTASSTSILALQGRSNVASPHAEIEDTIRAVPWRNIDNIAPAGSINSSVLDMAQWIRLHLNDGEYGGQRILSSAVVQEMQAPNTIVPLEGIAARLYPTANFQTYGLGWFLQDHRGRKIVHHGGNIDGMSAMVGMMPEEHLGVVILTNLNGTSLPTALMLRIFDAYLGAPPKDWSTDLHEAIRPLREQAERRQRELEEKRVEGTTPHHALEEYAGTYADADSLYGEVEVRVADAGLTLRVGPAVTGQLEHWHYETFRVTWEDRMLGKAFATFVTGADGAIDEVRVQNLATFDRRPAVTDSADAVALTDAERRRFVGRYTAEQPPVDLSIELLDGTLRAVLPGQPAYRLAALTPTTFTVSGIPIEVSIEFVMQGDRVEKVLLTQQGLTFELRPVR